MKQIFNLIICMFVCSQALANWSEKDLKAIDDIVNQAQESWEIPGLAVGCIFEDGSTWTKGYGHLERGEQAPVDSQTLFQIASLSKAFTAYLLSYELQEKDLSLDTTVKEVLPFFKLQDEYATLNCNFRDLLTHRSGLPGIADDSWVLWWHTNRSGGELISRMSSLPLTAPFRSKFAYNNMGYLVCGEASSAMEGKAWKDLLKHKITIPLGMERTTGDYSVLLSDQNAARPHLSTQIQIPSIQPFDWSELLPAGGLISCVDDMLLWLRFLMDDSLASETLTPQTLFDPKGLFKEEELPYADLFSHGHRIVSYNLGWMAYTLDQTLWLYHTGITDGQQSMILFSPEKKFGVVVLSNASVHPACPVIVNSILDVYRGQRDTSWIEVANASREAYLAALEEKRAKLIQERDADQPISCSQESYSGIFKHPAYGKVLIYPQDSKGMMKLKWMTGDDGSLRHWGGEQFTLSLPFTPSDPPWVTTYIKENQEIVGLNIPPFGLFIKKQS